MMIQLTPDQIANLWDYIKFAFEESIPPYIDKGKYDTNLLLSSLLSGKGQCWILYEEVSNGKRFEGVAITQIIEDTIAQVKNLLVYSLYGDNISEKTWKHGLVSLAKWGLMRGCKSIVAYTDNEIILNKVKQFNGTITSFISIPFTEE